MKLIKYIPFTGITNYCLEYKDNQPVKLYFNDNSINSFQLEIKNGGYVPKSGLFLCKSIVSLVKNKSILEIGTGETGIISIFSSKHGAKSVTATDIDKETVKWARRNGRLNKINNISWLISDKYSKIKGKFDIIVSNPPQLPMVNGSLHDSGGRDGRSIIDQIIIDAKNHLNSDGIIIILVFDFLSTNKQLGKRMTIFNILKSNGFNPSIMTEVKRIIRPDGKTFEALKDIQKYYPKYNFIDNESGDKCYKMQIIRGDLF